MFRGYIGPPGYAPWGNQDNDDIDENERIASMPEADQRYNDHIQEMVRETREYFETAPGFRFEQFVAHGGYGFTCRIGQSGHGLRRERKLIVKRALNDYVTEDLSNEIQVMSRLNGSAHIARVVAYKDDSNNAHQQRRRCKLIRRAIDRIKGKPPPNLLAGLAGPTLILEYLRNGTLDRLVERVTVQDRVIPNRILWAIFLCLVRACVAMEYPRGASPDSNPRLEEIPPNLPTGHPSGFRHDDMHMGNIMFGDLGDFQEHNMIPPAKLIDFGLGTRLDESAAQNLLDVSSNMMSLIMLRQVDFRNRRVHNGIETFGAPLLPDLNSGREPYPLLDLHLRDFLVRCMATSPGDRPELSRVLQVAKEACQERGAQYYGPQAPQESDEEIQRFIQEFVLDA
ncbi:hypothetical protein NUW58_g3644 [Xylaria curta]|uniref:Uncharacterized protein n=1 Tax=Xylaria curta TaxID=42375 RepID=A0ACC1PBP4_9PEZI|nr:hypothetical protein NUW58_g3644 [Xylaria curta]